ncbi:hypothetical protein GJ654_19745 [Rhodoblastus acidophilus]|uniref:Uncharacterized protein n=1 Tax=Rhodoblastus acidophilus TaxID=1074 RepID=A0A6N8DSE1_RHOAC|nr:hypothetical protein [Rhodoblastus acidophilus]
MCAREIALMRRLDRRGRVTFIEIPGRHNRNSRLWR